MSNLHHKDERRIAQLKRLMLAEQSMVLAIDGCKSALARTDLSDNERAVIMAGIVTLYVSPFTEATNLGKLEAKYESFPNEELKKTHESIFYLRHQFVAHRDLSDGEARVMTGGKSAPFYTPVITVVDSQRTVRHCSFIMFSPTQYRSVQTLCEFQFKRITEKTSKLFGQLAERSTIKLPGTYLLGDGFPY